MTGPLDLDTSLSNPSLFTSRYCPVTRPAKELTGYVGPLRYAPREPTPNAKATTTKGPDRHDQ